MIFDQAYIVLVHISAKSNKVISWNRAKSVSNCDGVSYSHKKHDSQRPKWFHLKRIKVSTNFPCLDCFILSALIMQEIVSNLFSNSNLKSINMVPVRIIVLHLDILDL